MDTSIIVNIILSILSFLLAVISVVTVVITLRQNNKMIESNEQGKKILEKLNLEENVRGEELSIEQYANLSELINIKL